MVSKSNPAVKEAVAELNMRVQVSLMDVLSEAYGEGFVTALKDVKYKEPPDIKQKDTQAMLEATELLVAPIRDYNEALAEKVSEIISEGFEAGLDQFEVAANLRSRIPEILNNEPVTIQREGKRPVSFTAEAYADLVADTVPYAVRNAGYVSGLEAGGADGWISVAAGDERMCEECGDKNGKIYKFGDPLPPYHNHCRCRPVAYYKEKEPGEKEAEDKGLKEEPGEEGKDKGKSPIGDKERIQRVIDALTRGTPVSKDLAAPGLQIERPVLENKPLNLETSPTISKYSAKELKGDLNIWRADGEDKILYDLAKETGYDKQPLKVQSKDLDKIVEAGHKELFRGLSEQSYATQLMEGDYFAGTGVYGNGIYTSYGGSAIDVVTNYTGSNGAVTRMALDKNARVITSKELTKQISAYKDRLIEEEEEARNKLIKMFGKKLSKTDLNTQLEAVSARYRALYFVSNDPGRYATLFGYDAIDIVEEKYMLVLNRAALYIQDNAISGNALNSLKEITSLERELAEARDTMKGKSLSSAEKRILKKIADLKKEPI